jgi:hypothetical protein
MINIKKGIVNIINKMRYNEQRLKRNSQKNMKSNLTNKNSKKLINNISILLVFFALFEKK